MAAAPWADGDPFGKTRVLLVTAVLFFDEVTGIILLIVVGLLLARQLRRGLLLGY